MLAISLLKMIRKPLHTPWSVCCCKVFALSSDHCPVAGIPERCLLLASISRPASVLDKQRHDILQSSGWCCCLLLWLRLLGLRLDFTWSCPAVPRELHEHRNKKKLSSTSFLVRVFLFAVVHGVEVASRSNSPANGAAAKFIGLGDETGHEGNIVDDGEEQNDENVGGFMRKSDMTSKTEDDCFAQTRLHAAST